MSRLTPKEKQRVVDYYLALIQKVGTPRGATTALAKEFGVVNETIINILQRSGAWQRQRPNFRIKRAKRTYDEIIERIETGDYTLQEVGDWAGITRERVRQIVKMKTGNPAQYRLKKERMERQERERVEGLQVGFYCLACGVAVKNAERDGHQCYCVECSRIRKSSRIPHIYLKCKICGKLYHPNSRYRNTDMMDSNTCSSACGGEWKSRLVSTGQMKSRWSKDKGDL